MVRFNTPLCLAFCVRPDWSWLWMRGDGSPRYRLTIAAAVVLTLFALLLSDPELAVGFGGVADQFGQRCIDVRIAAARCVAHAVPVGLWQHDILEDRWSDAWQELGQWRESPETSVGWRVARWMRLGRWGLTPLGWSGYGGFVGGPGGYPVRAQSRFSSEREGPLNLHNIGPTLTNWRVGVLWGSAVVPLR